MVLICPSWYMVITCQLFSRVGDGVLAFQTMIQSLRLVNKLPKFPSTAGKWQS